MLGKGGGVSNKVPNTCVQKARFNIFVLSSQFFSEKSF